MNNFVNCLPEIEKKIYLELGIGYGLNYAAVRSRYKYGVDHNSQIPATFSLTTDDFFYLLRPDFKFDVVYIDACHSFSAFVKDFNNSVAHLNKGGCIFAHDLVPPAAHYTAPCLCDDGYRALHYIMTNKIMPCYTSMDNCGLTFFPNPIAIQPPSDYAVSYQNFMSYLQHQKRYADDELQELIANYENIL